MIFATAGEQKNVLEFEQHIQDVIHNLFGKWDGMSQDKKLQMQGFDILDCEYQHTI